LLMILQRYTFGSKSQQYHLSQSSLLVAYDIAKIYIWKQITTPFNPIACVGSCLWYCKDIHLEANHNTANLVSMFVLLLMILQRYTFGSKSQRVGKSSSPQLRCLWYCKDIHLEANHNARFSSSSLISVAYDIAKIYIWKQITTCERCVCSKG